MLAQEADRTCGHGRPFDTIPPMRRLIRPAIIAVTALLLLTIGALHLENLDILFGKLCVRINHRGFAFLWCNSAWDGLSNIFTHPDYYGYASLPHFEDRGLLTRVPCFWLPWWLVLLAWLLVAIPAWRWARPRKTATAFPVEVKGTT
jgi:hypothetical protein